MTVIFEELVQGSGKKPYVVKFYDDGSNYCSCPSWQFKKNLPAKQRACKHSVKLYPKVIALTGALPTDSEDES